MPSRHAAGEVPARLRRSSAAPRPRRRRGCRADRPAARWRVATSSSRRGSRWNSGMPAASSCSCSRLVAPRCQTRTRSGFMASTRSTSSRPASPMRGDAPRRLGEVAHAVVPTSVAPAPAANTSSVRLGASVTTRRGGLGKRSAVPLSSTDGERLRRGGQDQAGTRQPEPPPRAGGERSRASWPLVVAGRARDIRHQERGSTGRCATSSIVTPKTSPRRPRRTPAVARAATAPPRPSMRTAVAGQIPGQVQVVQARDHRAAALRACSRSRPREQALVRRVEMRRAARRAAAAAPPAAGPWPCATRWRSPPDSVRTSRRPGAPARADRALRAACASALVREARRASRAARRCARAAVSSTVDGNGSNQNCGLQARVRGERRQRPLGKRHAVEADAARGRRKRRRRAPRAATTCRRRSGRSRPSARRRATRQSSPENSRRPRDDAAGVECEAFESSQA